MLLCRLKRDKYIFALCSNFGTFLRQKQSFLQSSCPLLLAPLDVLLHFDRHIPMKFSRPPPCLFSIHSLWQESHSWYYQQLKSKESAIVVDKKVAAGRMLRQTVVGCIRGGGGRGGCRILLNINHSDKTLPPHSPVRPTTWNRQTVAYMGGHYGLTGRTIKNLGMPKKTQARCSKLRQGNK